MLVEKAYASSDTITIKQTESPPKSSDAFASGWTSMIPMVLIFVVFYFLLIRPQEKRRKQQELLISGVKKGEEVLTTSGIFGIVTKINDTDNTVEIEIAKGASVKFLKTAIADILSRKKEEKTKQQQGKQDKKVINSAPNS